MKHTTCPDCAGSGLRAGIVCSTCSGSGEVRDVASGSLATTTTKAIPSATINPAARATTRDDAAERLVRTLVESGVSSEHMLDALQLLALAGAASAGVAGDDADALVQRLAERVHASVRERLGVETEEASADDAGDAGDEHARKGRGKRRR